MEALKVLEELGSKKIKEQTRISEVALGAILNRDFSKLHRVQFYGFVKILEEQYELDLSQLKHEYDAYQQEHAKTNNQLFIHLPGEKKSFNGMKLFIALAVIVLVALISYFILDRKSEMKLSEGDSSSETTKTIEKAKEHLNITDDTLNETQTSLQENTKSDAVDVNESNAKKSVDQKSVVKSLSLVPKVQIWVGMVDLSNHERSQKMTSEEYDLNASKDWLIILGHGRVDILNGSETLNFDTPEMLRFSYIEGKVEEISREQFKELNLGRNW